MLPHGSCPSKGPPGDFVEYFENQQIPRENCTERLYFRNG